MRPALRIEWVAWAGLLLCLPLLAGCQDGEELRRPNIIILTVDTLRADHLRLYGYHRHTMPATEEFAATATVFDSAVVPRGSTRPSYASMLTGLYPFRHGVRGNFMGLHADATTLIELLREAGYHTAGFVSNFVLVDELSGIGQGFDVYDDFVDDDTKMTYERRAAGTLRAINRWLGSNPPQPFVLFTNFIDPHGPYRPPKRYHDLYRSGRHRPVDLEKVPRYQIYGDSTNYFDYVDRYDGEIRYTDEVLGMLIGELKERGLWEEAVVIFTADHGESLGEHGIFFEHHAQLWEATTRVPLAIRLPEWNGRPPVPRTNAVCSPMDLMPTLLDLVGIDYDGPSDGRSLLPILSGETPDDRTILLEFPDVATAQKSLPDVFAVRTASHKLVRIVDPSTGELHQEWFFDLTEDPSEQRPEEIPTGDPVRTRMVGRLDELIAEAQAWEPPYRVTEYEMPIAEQPEFVRGREKKKIYRELSEEQIEKLRSLGYID